MLFLLAYILRGGGDKPNRHILKVGKRLIEGGSQGFDANEAYENDLKVYHKWCRRSRGCCVHMHVVLMRATVWGFTAQYVQGTSRWCEVTLQRGGGRIHLANFIVFQSKFHTSQIWDDILEDADQNFVEKEVEKHSK